uniref:Uncharacterized protein n=1 Tax=viral metagenome TaxID=1070528 RepID=A0A6C0DS24_9ZZZZ
MSSSLTSYSQVDASVRFLRALATTTVYTPTKAVASNIPVATFSASTTSSTYPSGTLFRDMGKRVVTFGTNNAEVAFYTLVQPQQGPATEGVPLNYATKNAYVQVWASSDVPAIITVGRVG